MDTPRVSPPRSRHTGRTLRLGTLGPTLQPLGSRASLTFNLLRCKLDLKGDPRGSECLAWSRGWAQASAWLPRLVPIPAPTTSCHLP